MCRRPSGAQGSTSMLRDDADSHTGTLGPERRQGRCVDHIRVRMELTRDCATTNLTRVILFENTVRDRSVEVGHMQLTEGWNEGLLLPRKGRSMPSASSNR